MTNSKVYSVIIPVKDEAQSLPQLHRELHSVMTRLKSPYELLFIDDGSTDHSNQVIRSLQKKNSAVRLITFRANFGKSAALSAGFNLARGSVIITLDADLQDDPRDIPGLLSVLDKGYDLVCGWRKRRNDTFTKKVSSYLFNHGTALLTGIKLHDVNCGLKVLNKQVAEELYIHGELHRFLPILAVKRKFQVTEAPTHHRPRQFGKSKYGLERSWRGIVDLLTTIFLSDYAGKPAHFFGKIGLTFFTAGFIMDLYVSYLRLSTGSTQGRIPLLLAGILFIVLGVQLMSTGLIAEMIIHRGSKQDDSYWVK